jgi:hypothetical protein
VLNLDGGVEARDCTDGGIALSPIEQGQPGIITMAERDWLDIGPDGIMRHARSRTTASAAALQLIHLVDCSMGRCQYTKVSNIIGQEMVQKRYWPEVRSDRLTPAS